MQLATAFSREGYRIVVLASLAAVAVAGPATNPSSGAWGTTSSRDRATRIEGNVLTMEDLGPGEGAEPGVQLRVRTASGDDVVVHLGPRWFVLQNDFRVTRGEPITIVGVTFRLEGKRAIVADRVKTKDRELLLREEGRPRWRSGVGPPSK